VRQALGSVLGGLMLGAALSFIGFSSWDEVHAMFTFASLRLTLAFATAVVVIGLGWLALRPWFGAPTGRRRFHRGTLAGGVLFGVGWAVCGACPSIAFVQVGEGQLGGLVTLGGIALGNWLYAAVNDRLLHWSGASCKDD
jgi:hypothetical protein